MAKKNYVRLDTGNTPQVDDAGDLVKMTMIGHNDNGTAVEVTAFIEKWQLPSVVAQIAKIARTDAENATEFAERIRKSAQ